jgi:beta-mannosidase
MSGHLLLNGTWGLTHAEGDHRMPPRHYTSTQLHGRALLPAAVPAPIHQVLLDAGLLDDPNIGLNSLRARWVEECFWIYRHTFTAPAEAAAQQAWLTFARLEQDAVIYLNGVEVGRHANAHRPACFNVSGTLRAGENLLVVRIESGIFANSDRPSQDYFCGEQGWLTKRSWRRTPQYQSGWDWHPRLMNVGILGDVTLDWHPGPRLAQTTVYAMPSADLATATVTARATVDNPAAEPVAGVLRARIVETGQETTVPVTLASGENRVEAVVTLEHPRLWWPIGQGEPFRYTVDVELETPGDRQTASLKTGVRRVQMDQSPHPVEGRYCILTINNRPVFCKGGNWVPADMLYSTVTPERYRALVQLAVDANFNTLRIWGGALYAEHALLDVCDEMGVLVWHDFAFACAQYPAHDPAFAAEVQAELTHVIRELAHHPSLAVWCGSNEIEWGDWNWGYDRANPAHPHYVIFHRDIPRLLVREDPSTLHWMSSPWSPDYGEPNDPVVGDQHPWKTSMEAGGANWWNYRTHVDRFPNEGGVLGASTPATLRQFLPANEQHLLSMSWDHHDNPFAAIDSDAGELGHAYKTVELWLGYNPLDMALDDYAYVSGLLHAEGLAEYISNYRRRMYDSASAIFWMYNDSWPVTHGWTIVDYYLRKKLAFHPVRRAFAPVTVVVADEGDNVVVFGVNDSPQAWTGILGYGLFNLAGGRPVDECLAVTLPANASTPLATIAKAQWETLGTTRSGAFAVLSRNGLPVVQHRLFVERFKDLEIADVTVTAEVKDGTLVLTSDAFAWGVCLDVDGDTAVADNCIDLLPGVPYIMPWDSSLGEPTVLRIGNRDAWRKVGVG